MLQTNLFTCSNEIIVSQILQQVILAHAEKFFIPPKIVKKNCQSDSYQLNDSVVHICLAKHSQPSIKITQCQESKPLTVAFKVRKTHKFILKTHQTEETQQINSPFQLSQSRTKILQNLHNHEPLQIQKYNNRVSSKEGQKDEHKRSTNLRNSFCFKDTTNSYFFNKATVRQLFQLRCEDGNSKDQKIERILRKNKLNAQKNMQQVKNYIINCPSKVLEQKNPKSLNVVKNTKSISTYFNGSIVNMCKNGKVCDSKKPIQVSVQIQEGQVHDINNSTQSPKFDKIRKTQDSSQLNDFAQSKFLNNFPAEDQKVISNAKMLINKMKNYKKENTSYAEKLKNVPRKISFRTFDNIKNNKQVYIENEDKNKSKQKATRNKIKLQNSLLNSMKSSNKPNFRQKIASKNIQERREKKQLVQIGNNRSFELLFGNQSFQKEKRLRFNEN